MYLVYVSFPFLVSLEIWISKLSQCYLPAHIWNHQLSQYDFSEEFVSFPILVPLEN